ncbi:PREDICTED: F-box protein At1g30200-like isoform X2 [Camelina sativa]|uniref:F-box protein At1g30200-like isoform X1 n=1 Tax=Camelina sativa TaxID=90675 RepID=A0ABM0YE10_CAMSA|nr:PREDICTED: F-box protein At1g30200-like isoform X1 [Camelina sativa]XP_010499544.1 PREDICTED: F-box protein At1g30200-like isoform X2 [Camelina sativa]
MSYLLRSDPVSRIHPEPQSLTSFDHFDLLPDSLLLLIFDKVADVKDLGRCCIVSRRFHSLVPFVENVLVRVDCVISDDDSSSDDDDNNNRRFSLNAASISDAVADGGSFSALFRLVFAPIFKPFQALGQFLGPKRSSSSSSFDGEIEQGGVTHHSPTQVLKNFNEIRFLRIELPTGELGVEDGILLKWRADFGSTLDNCMILGASSVIRSNQVKKNLENCVVVDEDNGNIPESFYTNGGLKLRVVWTISSLIAASARHYLLQPIITEHKTLDRLVLSDADGQGVLCMDREQLEELRVTPLSASSASKRTLVPALNMRLWYAPQLDLPDGSVLKGATLVAIRPSESKKEVCDASWLSDAFEEPYGTAAKMLIKRRTYCLEMNSF